MPGDLDLTHLVALAAVVLGAFAVETALGFGATLISVALGSLILPIPALLPALVPVNLALSTWLAVRYARQIDRAFLLRRLLPLMALGLPLGMALFRFADASSLKRVFGAFLVVLSSIELWRMRATRSAAPAPLARPAEIALLVAGGVVHGAFATGGPMAVYVSSRAIHDKGAYRATLCVLWALLNSVLLASYAIGGDLDAGSLAISASLVPSLALGLVLGEIAHHRVPVPLFRAGVFVGLAIAGAMLLARA